jgi:hypothetical protein
LVRLQTKLTSRITMIRHEHIWRAVDHLAAEKGMSVSALARTAGLDPTIFNRSKRHSARIGKARWLSTESVAKVLNATGGSLTHFGALADEASLAGGPAGSAPSNVAKYDCGGKAGAVTALRYRAEAARARAESAAACDAESRQAWAEIAAVYDRLTELASQARGDAPSAACASHLDGDAAA